MYAITNLNCAQAAPPANDFRWQLHEVLDVLECASVSLEMLAGHGVVHSSNFDQLVEFVGRALEAASAIQEKMQAPAKTIFPTEAMAAMAQAFCAMRPLEGGRSYQIHVDGAGRATISIHLRVEYL